MATNSFIQVPPDSVGKRLYTQQHIVDALPVQAQVVHIGCAQQPGNIQRVDGQGQAFTRFAEGSPSLDSFGNLRTSSANILGGYEYTNADITDLFQDKVLTGGTFTWNQSAANTVMSVTSASGSSTSRTTNRYHYYQPGVGNLVILTLAQGDSGKANNTRRWGYYDDSDGPYFELNGTTLNVVLRSSVSGSVVETRIPQASWNGDKFDGTGTSQMNIDVTKANFFFIDFAWLGVGSVRMGILASDGSRWVVHTFQNPNNNLGAYMRSGSLPIRFENFNTGVTASTTEMKLICGAVYAESSTDYTFWRFSDIETSSAKTVTTNTPVLSMKAAPGTRAGLYPESLNVFVTGGNVKLSIIDNAVLTGATWAVPGANIAVGDIAATAFTGGEKFKTWYVPAGVTNIPVSEFYETNDEGYHRLADDSDSYTFTLAASKLDGTTVTVTATLNYRELA